MLVHRKAQSYLLDPKSSPSPDTLLNLSTLQFPHWLNGGLVPTHPTELFWGLNELVHIKHLETVSGTARTNGRHWLLLVVVKLKSQNHRFLRQRRMIQK